VRSDANRTTRRARGLGHLALASVAALLLTLAFAVSPTMAAKKIPVFDFGGAPGGPAGSLGGQFNTPRGIAINQSGSGGVAAGTVYVVDFNNNRIQSFDADGDFIRAWGHDVLTGGGTGFEVCEVADDCKAGIEGGAAGQFNRIAGGIAVDQVTGDVFIVDRGNFRVQAFSATGGFLRVWGADVDTTGGIGFEVCEIAANCKAGVAGPAGGMFAFGSTGAIVGIGTDSASNVYVADAGNGGAGNYRVQKFEPGGGFLAAAGWDVDAVDPSTGYEVCTVAANCKAGLPGSGAGQFANANSPSFLATAPSGETYVADVANGRIVHLDSALALLDAEFAPTVVAEGSGTLRAIAVNPADGHVLFAKTASSSIYEVDPIAEAKVEEHLAELPNWVGLAVDGSSGRMYAARDAQGGGGHFVRVFDEGVVSPTPVIEAPDFTSWTGATLKGTVDPEGIELTECFFEWGATTSYGNIAPCEESPAEIGAGTDPVAVHADISGLEPNGATHHVRLVAANANAPANSGNESFQTPEAVVTNAATATTGSATTLNGTVNPVGVPLSDCSFEYGTTTAYGQSVPCEETPAEIGTGSDPVPVHAEVGDLEAGTIYHFRLVAANAIDGTVTGEDEGFLTLGPAIAETWAEDVGLAEATLKAKVDPEGKATTYRFEYGTSEAYGQQTPELAVGFDSAVHEVSAFLDGLQAGAIYHYRLVATNPDAMNEGPDRTFTTYSLPAPDTNCPNQAFRTAASAALPDCRAYEMVSPTDKGGGDIVASGSPDQSLEAAWRQSSLEGNRLTYTSTTAFGDAQRGAWANQYLASRGTNGWLTHGLNPPQGTTLEDPNPHPHYDRGINFLTFTEDLCRALLRDHNSDPLTSDALLGHTNLYVRDNCGVGADTYQALTKTLTSPANEDLDLWYGRFSRDGRHIVFGADAALLSTPAPASTDNQQIYDFFEGELRLVSVLPTGEASEADAGVGSTYVRTSHPRYSPLWRAISDDGSRIFWTDGSGRIYVRVNGEETVAVSSGAALFLTAATDGSAAIYRQGDDLFEVDVDKALAGEPGATTRIAGEVGGVSNTGGVVGASDDLSYLYFISREDLAEGATDGQHNVYLRRKGEEIFVATVSSTDRGAGVEIGPNIDSEFAVSRSSRVTPDGHQLIFMSNRSLTGYDNADAITGEVASEIYRYDAVSEELTCISCNPSGARPLGRQVRPPYHGGRGTLDLHVAAWLPTFEWGNHGKRSLSADGNRVFFNSFDDLVLRDTNGAQDVYQWEAPGTGGCDEEDADYFKQNSGCLSLISSGKSSEDSELVDASANGRDVFFTTAESLDERRDPGAIDIYDAREGGGFPPPPPPPPPCVGDACQGVPTLPGVQTPTSAAFQGPGDPSARKSRKPRCGKGKRRVVRTGKRRCVKKQGRRANRKHRRAGR